MLSYASNALIIISCLLAIRSVSTRADYIRDNLDYISTVKLTIVVWLHFYTAILLALYPLILPAKYDILFICLTLFHIASILLNNKGCVLNDMEHAIYYGKDASPAKSDLYINSLQSRLLQGISLVLMICGNIITVSFVIYRYMVRTKRYPLEWALVCIVVIVGVRMYAIQDFVTAQFLQVIKN